MGWFYRQWIRPVLFSWDPEAAHQNTLMGLKWIGDRAAFRTCAASLCPSPRLPVNVMGMSFPNPVGIAAGLDKHADAVPMWEALGFGFSELGGVTSMPQEGQPRPRMFRVEKTRALINRMGFNNPGAVAMADRLKEIRGFGAWPRHPVGINLGKSKDVPLSDAPGDYAWTFKQLLPHADFFVVNVSSPNTPNLRKLQDRSALEDILKAMEDTRDQWCQSMSPGGPSPENKPILVKVSPDLSATALDEILELTESCSIAGLVATNTTTFRKLTGDSAADRWYAERGGLSGQPLRQRSLEVIRHLHQQTRGRLTLIGVGGIFNAQDAWEKIVAGASLVQVYSGLVFEGPGMVEEIVDGLSERLNRFGFQNLSQAVGSGAMER